jgi:hypothetical protein
MHRVLETKCRDLWCFLPPLMPYLWCFLPPLLEPVATGFGANGCCTATKGECVNGCCTATKGESVNECCTATKGECVMATKGKSVNGLLQTDRVSSNCCK